MKGGGYKNRANVKLPTIKQKNNVLAAQKINKSLKLQKINRQKHNVLNDFSKINKIEKQYQQITQRKLQEPDHKQKQDQMRQSKLLLLKNIAPPNKKNNNNLLSNLLQYQAPGQEMKSVVIPAGNITLSPVKKMKRQKKVRHQGGITSHYTHAADLQKADFVKMFIVQQLLYYVSKTQERLKQEMAGFCKFYNENTAQLQSYEIVSGVIFRSKDYLNSVFLQKLGFYIFLILGTEEEQQQTANLLCSLTQYIHTNNLIILDLLMEIIDYQKFSIASQFHVYNTLRFNEDRRKIRYDQDKMNLVAKNNHTIADIIQSIAKNSEFQSLKTFVLEIISSQDAQLMQKIKEVTLMLISLDSILAGSIHQQVQKPSPPFLPASTKTTPYTLVLDMDQTLIHTKTIQSKKSIFLQRPYCQQFLNEMAVHYQIVIFTAAVKDYADQILNQIDKKGRISYRLYRQHTRIQDFVSIKDLAMIGRDLTKTIIIDNIASNFKMQPRNGIAIQTWVGDPQDISLLNLIPVLTKLATQGVKDVRNGLEHLSAYMQMRLSKGQEIIFSDISLKGL